MRPEQVIFIHIPKAAGQTVRAIVGRQYPHHEIRALDEPISETYLGSLIQRRQTRIFVGHMGYGLHRHLQGPWTYVTVMREPTSRVLSLYRYILTNPQHPLNGHAAKAGLVGFLSSDADSEEIDNGQTRQIAGVSDGSVDESSLARAKQNLAETFRAIGLVERFDESVILFKRRLDWRMPFYVRKNVTPTPPVQITNEARGVIERRNALDLELYQFARDLFQEHVRREGPCFDVEVAAFKRLNTAAGIYRDAREWASRIGTKASQSRG